MEGVPLEIVKRQIGHCYKIDPEYGLGLARRMGIATRKVDRYVGEGLGNRSQE
ncbi:MAG: hypothetical protein HY765_08605 [Rhodomicrobium sp.]|nr:hypothetical protein [Rhodomicrobium sp.]